MAKTVGASTNNMHEFRTIACKYLCAPASTHEPQQDNKSSCTHKPVVSHDFVEAMKSTKSEATKTAKMAVMLAQTEGANEVWEAGAVDFEFVAGGAGAGPPVAAAVEPAVAAAVEPVVAF